MLLRICRHTAITAQQFCSIEVASNLLVSDGISKTVVWKNQDAPNEWNFADARTFPLSARRC
jgi:hypothetical protein